MARRKRYEEVHRKLESGEVQDVNDLITLNLDIWQFAQDVILNCEGPDLLRAFWNVTKDISILDPTCGSGAFLFAALNILEPLYEACLDRMAEMLEDEAAKHNIVGAIHESPLRHTPHDYPLLPHKKLEDFSNILEQVANHPNKQYFIYKSIILNNLYGVDIMEEAVEICKLRLFLKLAAQVDPDTSQPNFGIEPLPDIDFNIRAGNTLVGFTALEQIKKAITTEKHGQVTQRKLLHQDDIETMKRIEEKAQDIDRLFTLFRQQQTELGGEITTTDKQELKKRLKALEDELNRYLASEYGISPNNFKTKQPYEKKFSEWLTAHKPFHWFIEFHAIMNDGGFDVIIGNPPYVEYREVRRAYTVHCLETELCNNLYAFVMERSVKVLREKGRCGMIVPISAFCTDRMEKFQLLQLSNSSNFWLSNYAERPSKLFEGVERNLSITIFDKKHSNARIFTTGYLKWYAENRVYLFPTINYTIATNTKVFGIIPKISTQTEVNVLKKIQKVNSRIGNYTVNRQTKYILYYRNSGGRYWKIITDFQPEFFLNGRKSISSRESYLYFDTAEALLVSVASLNSSLYFWYYVMHSDARTNNPSDLKMFPLDIQSLSSTHMNKLFAICKKLMTDYKTKSIMQDGKYRTGLVKFQQFFPIKSKPIIDEIDHVLAKHYGFTDEELDFIINYDIKYRMGRDTDDEP